MHVELNVLDELKVAVSTATGNVKVQLLALVAGKKEGSGSYMYTISELQMFPETTKHYIDRARKYAASGKIGNMIIITISQCIIHYTCLIYLVNLMTVYIL